MAARNLLRNRRRSGITAATVAVGVAALLFASAYIEGLQILIQEAVTEASSGALVIERRGYAQSQELAPLELDLAEDPALEQKVLAVPNVRALAPRLRFVGFLGSGEASTMAAGLGVDPGRELQTCPRGPGAAGDRRGSLGGLERAAVGRGLSRPDEESAVLGRGLADGMQLGVGGTTTLLVQARGGAMDALDLETAGLFRSFDPVEDKHLVVIPLQVAQRLLHMNGRVTGYAVRLVDPKALDETAAALRVALAGVEPPLEVETWKEHAPYWRDVLRLQDSVLFVLCAIVFALVLAGVVNTMLMSVFERTREVGTLLALGFRRRRILTLFVLEAALLGGAAALLGAVVGTFASALAHAVGLPFSAPAVGRILNRPVLTVAAVVVSVVGISLGALVGGLLPAYRASRLSPVEALRWA
jgi:putative ABC transport system permease protein